MTDVFMPGIPGLVDGFGNAITLGTGLSYTGTTPNLTLNSSGGTGSSTTGTRVRNSAYEVSVRDGSFTITSPAYLTMYAENAGTLVSVRAAMVASSGFNLQYTLMHALPGQAGQPVPGLQNVGWDDGEAGADGKVGLYTAPLVTKPTGTVTYAVGDQLYFTFSSVGGTPTYMTLHLSVTESF